MKIGENAFNDFLTKKIDLNTYIFTDSLKTIHRWNLIDRWCFSDNCNSEQLCKNIEEMFTNYRPLTEAEGKQVKANLDAMKKKFGKRYLKNNLDFSDQGRKAFRCVETIEKIENIVKGRIVEKNGKRDFSSIAPDDKGINRMTSSISSRSPVLKETAPTNHGEKLAPKANTTQEMPKAITPPKGLETSIASKKTNPIPQEKRTSTRRRSRTSTSSKKQTPTPQKEQTQTHPKSTRNLPKNNASVSKKLPEVKSQIFMEEATKKRNRLRPTNQLNTK